MSPPGGSNPILSCTYIAPTSLTPSSTDIWGGYENGGYSYVPPGSPPAVTAAILQGGLTLYGVPDNGSHWGVTSGVVTFPMTFEARWTFDISPLGALGVCHATLIPYGFSSVPVGMTLEIQWSDDGSSWTTGIATGDWVYSNGFQAAPSATYHRYWSLHWEYTQGGSGLGFASGIDFIALLLWAA